MEKSCNCCNGTDVLTPIPIHNQPGLSQIRYRIGSYSSFMESMIARLNRSCPDDEAQCVHQNGPYPLRNRLKTRSLNDPSIAWLDAWASVADVLTFYQERIANESYLATAIRERSLHEISSLVGYLPRPGLSSSVILAFEVEKPVPSANGVTYPFNLPSGGVPIPAGTAVESTPAPGSNDDAQTFETSADFVGFEHWNAIKLRTTQPQRITKDTVNSLDRLFLKGTGLGLKINDVIFVNLPNGMIPEPKHYAIQKVVEDQDSQVTTIEFQVIASIFPPLVVYPTVPENHDKFEELRNQHINDISLKPDVFVLRTQCNVFGWNMPPANTISDSDVGKVVEAADVANVAIIQPPNKITIAGINFKVSKPFKFLRLLKQSIENAIRLYFKTLRIKLEGSAGEADKKVYLDGEFNGIRKDDYIAIRNNTGQHGASLVPYKVRQVNIHPRVAYQLRGNVTEVKLDKVWWPGGTLTDDSILAIQSARVYCEAQPLELAEEPLPAIIAPSDTIELDGLVEGLFVGQRIAVQGRQPSQSASTQAVQGELATIESVLHVIREELYGDRYVTQVKLLGIRHSYVRGSVRLLGNLVEATHGKTTYESVGDGDGFREFLKHQLTVSHISQLPVPTVPGSQNEIRVYVEDVRWPEVSDFVDSDSITRAFIAERDFKQRTTIVFGDGSQGSRPPTGNQIIKSRYRTGLGTRGNVAAGRIDQVAGSTLGVKSVINPLEASGGANPDESTLTRHRAPLSVTVFDRLVSLNDYRDFALSFAGVGKAVAIAIKGQIGTAILVIFAANHPGETAPDSKLFKNLLEALNHYGDNQVALTLQNRTLKYLVLKAKVQIELLHQWQVVEPKVRNALLAHFSYESSDFGKPQYLADAFQVIQSVAGVIHVEIPCFGSVDSLSTGISPLATANDVTLPDDTICFLSPDFENLFVLEQIS